MQRIILDPMDYLLFCCFTAEVKTSHLAQHQPRCAASCTSITSNTRDSVSLGYPEAEKRVENTTRSGVFQGVWIADETLSRVFDVPSQ